jgi:hypothetical protein
LTKQEKQEHDRLAARVEMLEKELIHQVQAAQAERKLLTQTIERMNTRMNVLMQALADYQVVIETLTQRSKTAQPAHVNALFRKDE